MGAQRPTDSTDAANPYRAPGEIAAAARPGRSRRERVWRSYVGVHAAVVGVAWSLVVSEEFGRPVDASRLSAAVGWGCVWLSFLFPLCCATLLIRASHPGGWWRGLALCDLALCAAHTAAIMLLFR